MSVWSEAAEVRSRFGPDIYFFLPALKHYESDEVSTDKQPSFVPVSVTGAACALKCDHCNGLLLETMFHVRSPEELIRLAYDLQPKGIKGFLVSGGAGPDGAVPLEGYGPALGRLKTDLGFTILVHTGLVMEKEAAELKEAGVDAVMLDIMGHDDTIREIYHLDARVYDYEKSLEYLTSAGLNVAPHVVIGIHRGIIKGELHALRILSGFPLAAAVLVVFMPLKGTPLENARPPDPNVIGDLIAEARILMPKTPLLLGCARPEGRAKKTIDTLALKAGVNGIAFPADGIIQTARSMGLEPHISFDCCAMIFKLATSGSFG